MTGDNTTPQRARHSRRRARRLAAAWIGLVGLASVVDPAAVVEVIGGAGTVTVGATDGTPGFAGAIAANIDVFVLSHFVAYGVLAWLLADGIGGIGGSEDDGPLPSRHLLIAVALAAAVGLGIELIQAPLAVRTASAVDAAVNGFGAVVGVAAREGFLAARSSNQ